MIAILYFCITGFSVYLLTLFAWNYFVFHRETYAN